MDQKTRVCAFCGIRVNLLRAKRLASAENSMMASEMLRKIKSDRQINTKKVKGKYAKKSGLPSFYK